MRSEGERLYPQSHGNETPPRADGGVGDCRMKRKIERIYIEDRKRERERETASV